MLDSGDAFARSPKPAIPPEAVLKRAELIVDSFNASGLDAYTVGERDLVLGLDNLRSLAGRAKYHFLGANLLNAENAPVFEASVVKKLGDIDVGIIGLLGQRASIPETMLQEAGLHVAAPAEIAAAETKRLKEKGADLIVVLSHLGHGEERLVAAAAPDIHLFIGSHAGRRLTSPVPVARADGTNAYWIEAGSRGKYLGRFEIYPQANGNLSTLADAGEGDALEASIQRRENSLEKTRKRLADLEKQTPVAGQEARHKARLDSTRRSLEHMEKQLDAEKTKLASMPPPSADRALFLNHIDSVTLAVAERADIKEKVAALQASGALTPTKRPLPTRPPLAGKTAKPQPKKR